MKAWVSGQQHDRLVAEGSVTASARRPGTRFLLLYALAYAGGVIAYTPFLMLVLPARVTALAGADDVRWLGYIVFAGAIAASLSGIASGWLSDVTRRRRFWVGVGLAATILLQLAMARAGTVGMLLCLVTAWQLALNLMLTPLIAWAGDCVPDARKGLLGGLLSIAPPLGALSAIALPQDLAGGIEARTAIIAAMTALPMLPLLLFARDARFTPPPGPDHGAPLAMTVNRITAQVWLARLLMQLSGAALAAYLYFWLRSLDPALGDAGKMLLFASGLVASVALALLLGRWTDRHGQGFAALALTAVLAGGALLAMAWAETALAAKLAYALFVAANGAFLALHASQSLRVLPDPRRRGLGLGLFNLTNTAPSLIMPWIAISLVPTMGYDALFLVLAGLALAAALLLVRLPRQ
jgi:MFS family permease